MITREEANRLIRQVQTNDKSVTTINPAKFERHGYDNAVMQVLEALKTNECVTRIDYAHSGISQKSITALAEALKLNRSVNEFVSKGTDLNHETVMIIADIMRENKFIRKINLSGSQVSDNDFKLFVDALIVNSSVTYLNIRGIIFGLEGVKALAEALRINNSMTEINLKETKIGDKGAIALAEALKENHSISKINLSDTSIKGEGTVAISEMLKTNRKIIELDLSSNNVGQSGVIALSDMIRQNNTISKLDLSNIDFDNGEQIISVKPILEALKGNAAIKSIDFRVNNLGSDEVNALAQALDINHTITDIILIGSEIGDDGAATLLAAMRRNYSVTYFDLEACDVTDQSIIRNIDRCLERNKLFHPFNKAMQELENMIGCEDKDLDLLLDWLVHARKELVKHKKHYDVFPKMKCHFDSMVIKAHLMQGDIDAALKYRNVNPNINPEAKLSLAESIYVNINSFRDKQSALGCIVDLFRDRAVRSLPFAMDFIGPVIWQIKHPSEVYELGLHIDDQEIEDFLDPFKSLGSPIQSEDEAKSPAGHVEASFFSGFSGSRQAHKRSAESALSQVSENDTQSGSERPLKIARSDR